VLAFAATLEDEGVAVSEKSDTARVTVVEWVRLAVVSVPVMVMV
jgi:hypothetical protein